MSLLSHLQNRASPVRVHIENHYPHHGSVRFAATGEPDQYVETKWGTLTITSLRHFSPAAMLVPPPEGSSYPYGDAGTGFDYLLRLRLGGAGTWSQSPAARGAPEVNRDRWARARMAARSRGEQNTGPPRPPAPPAWLELLSQVTTLDLERTKDREVAAVWAAVVAMYEQLYRMPLPVLVLKGHPLLDVDPDATLVDVCSLVDPRVPPDLVALLRVFEQTQPVLAAAETVIAGPTFAVSRELGGADADLVADGTLVEVKTTKRPQLGRDDVRQVLGYLLADTDNRYAITAVSWYYSRQGQAWTLPVGEFLESLAGHPVDLVQARADFDAVVHSLRAQSSSR